MSDGLSVTLRGLYMDTISNLVIKYDRELVKELDRLETESKKL